MHRQHERVAAHPPGDRFQTAQTRPVGSKRADQWLEIVSLEKLQRLTGRDHRSKLSKRSRRCADAKIGQIAHDQVDDEGGDERRYCLRPEGCEANQRHRRGRQHREQDVPRSDVDRIWPGEPPQVVSVRVLKTGKRDLRSFSQRGIRTEAVHQCVEGLEMVGDRRGPEPMIERVLSEGAFRPVERREDLV